MHYSLFVKGKHQDSWLCRLLLLYLNLLSSISCCASGISNNPCCLISKKCTLIQTKKLLLHTLAVLAKLNSSLHLDFLVLGSCHRLCTSKQHFCKENDFLLTPNVFSSLPPLVLNIIYFESEDSELVKKQ